MKNFESRINNAFLFYTTQVLLSSRINESIYLSSDTSDVFLVLIRREFFQKK